MDSVVVRAVTFKLINLIIALRVLNGCLKCPFPLNALIHKLTEPLATVLHRSKMLREN